MRIRTRAFLVALVLGLQAVVRAQSPETDRIDIAGMRAVPHEFLAPPPGECPNLVGRAKSLNRLLDDYRQSLFERKTSAARRDWESIQATLAENRAACAKEGQEWLHRAYLAKSLEILLDADLVEFKYPNGESLQGVRRLQKKPPVGATEMAVSNDFLLLLSLHLMSRVQIEFMPLGEKENHVIGAYRCHDQTIFLDPRLPPLDFAATWMHELDHLMRDLLGPTDAWKGSPAEAIRLDEMQASLMGSFTQWNTRRTAPQVLRSFGMRVLNMYFGDQENYAHDQFFVSWDGTYMNPKGAVSVLYSPSGAMYATARRFNVFDIQRNYFLSADLAEEQRQPDYARITPRRWTFGYQSDYDVNPKSVPLGQLLKRIDRIIVRGYFAGHELPPFRPDLYSSDQAVLSKLADELEFPRSIRSSAESPALSGLFAKLDLALGKPSAVCLLFEAAVERGDLDFYLGRQVWDTLPGERGTRPGKDGVKPGERGTRPGKDGVKPSQPLRPCLNLHDKL